MENRFELFLKQVRFELLQKIDSQEPENTLNTFCYSKLTNYSGRSVKDNDQDRPVRAEVTANIIGIGQTAKAD